MPKGQEDGIPYISPKDFLENGEIAFEKAKKISDEDFKSLCKKIYPEYGDILLSRYGTVGEVRLVKTYLPFQASYSIAIIKPIDKETSRFIETALRSAVVRSQINSYVRGVTQLDLGLGHIRKLFLPLPPLSEQKRILSILDELFTQLNAGVDLLKKLKVKLKRYRQAVLKAAVEGKLTQDWREAHQDELEPASALLARILKERREKWEAEQWAKMQAKGKAPKDDKWKLKYKEPAAPDTTELLKLPEGWKWVTLEQINNIKRTITYAVIKLGEHVDDGVPTLRSSNVRHLYLDPKGIKKISPNLSNEYSRTILQGGEVLVTIRGTLGGVIAVPNRCVGSNISREVAMISLAEGIVPDFCAIMIGSKPIHNWLSRRTKGIAYTGINIETLKRTPIPISSHREQIEIIEKVNHYSSICDEFEKTLDRSLKRAEKLRQSILKKAFEGKLAPQDPNDEPVSVLLARIQVEKAKKEAEEKAKKGKGRKRKGKGGKVADVEQLELIEVFEE